ncbi:MAG: nitronate monooxygenase [Deltaproteobacteria bacterium]|nr:nitronate monooxygenase [Deltaproteobacteria bacterium]
MSSALHTRLCEVLGIRYPIIQTAMGWIATPELTAATCNAGAFGMLAAATLRVEEAEQAITRVKQLTDRPFAVNFLMEQPGASEIVEMIIRHGVKAASYGRAPNAQFIERFKKASVLCIPTVGAARHAQKAVKLGADIIIAQGGEGGGHTGTVPTSILVPQVVDAVEVPVVAAGGFRDGRGLVAALAFGAAGIAMGTRFLLTAESPLPQATAERYFKATVNDIFVTRHVDGLPQRVIMNEFVGRLEASNPVVNFVRALRSGLEYRKLSGASVRELLSAALALRRGDELTRTQTLMAANAPVFIRRAMVEGRPAEGVLPSGVVAGLIDDRPTCAELIERIMREAQQTLAALGN